MLRKMLLRPSLQSLKKFLSPLANFATLFQILQKNFPLDRGHTLNVNKTLRRRPVQNVVWTSVSSICVMCPRELKHIYEALRSGLKKIREAVSFLMKYFIRTWRQLFPENKRNKLFKFSFSRKIPSFIYSILYCVEIAQIRSYFSSVFSCIQSKFLENTDHKKLHILTFFRQCTHLIYSWLNHNWNYERLFILADNTTVGSHGVVVRWPRLKTTRLLHDRFSLWSFRDRLNESQEFLGT